MKQSGVDTGSQVRNKALASKSKEHNENFMVKKSTENFKKYLSGAMNNQGLHSFK